MKPNIETINLIKTFEGLRLEAYLDPVGIVTIGYGYTNDAGFGPGVKLGDKWSKRLAEEMLALGLEKFGHTILPMMTRAPTQSQFGAMLSLAWNIGVGSFSRSTCLKRFNAGDIEGAAEALQWFNKAGGKVLRGLVRRREAEAKLMLSDIDDRPIELVTARPDAEKTASKSTTIQATVATGVAGATGVGTAIGSLDGDAQMVVVIAACIAAIGLVWIFRERLKKLGGGV